ncbi:dihydrodipicolinate synthase family protein [Paraburkholderia fungorum]|uniref:Dihydrodipicolinate synthase family protein n=1 Tax=Paraburkholderia fungorum TaxID=134537 RepID=A0A3R7E056_9BURK|nr:dihydrodipicolinate synthase family protein [Paraburkholderia fungorum]RKF30524.1 dihydrodipicolinate synthase family protein [Paraburkholderia fungorum]
MIDARPTRLRGVLAPVVTPFHANLEANATEFVRHCRWLLENGAGLAIFGTNSEANSLSVAERIRLTDTLLEAGVPAASMMPGTGTSSLTDTVLLTRHAVDAGAAGVLILPPFFYKKISDDGLFAYYAEVIERIGDARMSLYLYNIPALSGVPITLELIERLLKRYPETIAGVKDSSGDWHNTKAMIDVFARDGLDIFPASEALLSTALPLGAAGCISATANVNPGDIALLCERLRNEKATALQEKVTLIRKLFETVPMIPAMKQVIAYGTDDRDWMTVRPPLEQLKPDGTAMLIDALTTAGFDFKRLKHRLAH